MNIKSRIPNKKSWIKIDKILISLTSISIYSKLQKTLSHMSRFLKELAGQLNQIRDRYITSNNQICADIKSEVINLQKLTGQKNIPITNAARQTIDDNIFFLQRRSVLALEEALELFLYGISHSRRRVDSYQKRFSKTVIDDLERLFSINPYPPETDRLELANKHKLSFKQITNWFTNKRNRSKPSEPKYYSISFSNE